MSVSLRPLTPVNWRQVLTVEVAEDQRRFLVSDSILDYLAESRFYPSFIPYGVWDNDTVVGFVSFGPLPDDATRWWVTLLVVDRNHQRRGYGRAALEAVIAQIRRDAPECRVVGLSYDPENAIAARLYAAFGFEAAGEANERGEVRAWLSLKE